MAITRKDRPDAPRLCQSRPPPFRLLCPHTRRRTECCAGPNRIEGERCTLLPEKSVRDVRQTGNIPLENNRLDATPKKYGGEVVTPVPSRPATARRRWLGQCGPFLLSKWAEKRHWRSRTEVSSSWYSLADLLSDGVSGTRGVPFALRSTNLSVCWLP